MWTTGPACMYIYVLFNKKFVFVFGRGGWAGLTSATSGASPGGSPWSGSALVWTQCCWSLRGYPQLPPHVLPTEVGSLHAFIEILLIIWGELMLLVCTIFMYVCVCVGGGGGGGGGPPASTQYFAHTLSPIATKIL